MLVSFHDSQGGSYIGIADLKKGGISSKLAFYNQKLGVFKSRNTQEGSQQPIRTRAVNFGPPRKVWRVHGTVCRDPMLDLPPELINLVCSHLRSFETERVAQTFNKRLYPICLPFLAHRLAMQRNAKRMISIFGDVSCTLGESQYQRLGFEPKHGPFTSPTLPNLDYLDLKGDLSWLTPLDDLTAKAMQHYHQGPAASSTQVNDLIASAERLSLVLPPEFVRFIRNKELQYRIPSFRASYFELSTVGLIKCPASIDGGAGGYLVRFLCDQQGCPYWALYLAPGIGHCVLSMALDPQGEDANEEEIEEVVDEEIIDKAKEEGVPVALIGSDDVFLAGASFEEFLATMYFEERIQMLLCLLDEIVLSPDLEKYVIEVYSGGNQGAGTVEDITT